MAELRAAHTEQEAAVGPSSQDPCSAWGLPGSEGGHLILPGRKSLSQFSQTSRPCPSQPPSSPCRWPGFFWKTL